MDVFTGISISTPQLPVNGDIHLYYAALTAPLSSPNSHLLINTGCHNYFWHVGSNSWLSVSHRNERIRMVVVFKGQVFGMYHDLSLCHPLSTLDSHTEYGS